MHTIVALSAAVVAFFSLSLIIPTLVALYQGDWLAVEAFLLTGLTLGFLSSASIMALMPRLRRLNRGGVFYSTIGMWLAFCLSATAPFILIEHMLPGYALFEAVSAAVTIGTTTKSVAEMSTVMIFYRGMVAWQGGLLTLLIAVYVLGRYRVGGTPNKHLRYILHSFQSGDPRIAQTFFEVFVPYAAITLVCAACLVLAQVDTADAINLALNVTSTNGFVPMQTGASVINNVAGEIIMLIFMIVGATSIIWHRALTNRKWQHAGEQPEVLLYLLSMVGFSVVAILLAVAEPSSEFSETVSSSALNAVFDVVSIMTTTGIVHDSRVGLSLPFELVLAIALIGGCSYSTAGGLKVFRLRSMLRHSANEVRKLVYPHLVQANSVDESAEELRSAKAVWSAFYVTILGLMCAAIIFSLQGVDMASSIGLTIGALSSVGSLVSQNLGPAPSEGVLMTVAITGLAARIELLLLLAAMQRSR